MRLPILLAAAAAIALPAIAHAKEADDRLPLPIVTAPAAPVQVSASGIPAQLGEDQRAEYRLVFAAIHERRWGDAQAQLDAMPQGPLHAIARAEIFTGKGSPKVEADPLRELLLSNPELPQAEQIARMARTRGLGDGDLPVLPTAQKLVWLGSTPTRRRAHSIKSDQAATEIALAIQPFLKTDNGQEAETLVERFADALAPEALTEWRQKVAWIYYVSGDNENARRVAGSAQTGEGEWAPQADWVSGLAAWRQSDCSGALAAFLRVAARAYDEELRSAGFYWASRADMQCMRFDQVDGHLRSAGQYGETFYGLLARQQLGMPDTMRQPESYVAADWQALQGMANVRVAAALSEVGEYSLADQVMRRQATLTSANDYPALVRISGRLNLAQTELWLAHNGPAGARPVPEAYFPTPNWSPATGWRVEKALVYAHALQESQFDTSARSRAGAIGLLQVRPGSASDMARSRGMTVVASDLTNPAINLEMGQTYIEMLRDQPFSAGLLPKVIAAYNAGPLPVTQWNATVKDGGDPLLWIESIPYWETRGYVMTVLRNYWVYERQLGAPSPSRDALAQGMWPRFPGLPGATATRVAAAPIAEGGLASAN